MCINTRITVILLARYLQCNGRKLKDVGGFSNFYSIYCVLESTQVRELLSNSSLFVGEL